ncbi:MAG TPA: lipid-binding SYLF domain-containing protein [Acidobacteriota bacterium]|nr:lipid-binding SYLF domain-containing protein [Acidobacteriota bacterium]
MKRLLFPILFGLIGATSLIAGSEVNDRVVRAAIVLKEITQTPDKSIPQDLLDKSSCVAVIPGMKKGGFIFGANYGKGLVSCRTDNGDGPWSAPSMLLLEGGSFGLQIGGQSVDLVLVIMNLSGLESMLNTKFTLGGDASVAAGPVGRTASAETDALMSAEILAYSRTRGLFAGLIIKGGVIRPDRDANHVLYDKAIEPKDILFKPAQSVPKDAKIFLDELTRISPKRLRK